MKTKRELVLHPIVENLIKIMNDSKLSKSLFAEKIGLSESKWNKISNNKQDLGLRDLSIVASRLGMSISEIDQYPLIDVKPSAVDQSEVLLQIKINGDTKKQVLDLIKKNKDIEIKIWRE